MADIAMPSEILIVDALPQLGAGKTDFVERRRQLVRERLAQEPNRSEPEPGSPDREVQFFRIE